jgi:hypothetical protein
VTGRESTGWESAERESLESPVDRCLDDLFDRLAGTGAAGRRALAEAEDHLRSAVDDGLARGLSRDVAQREAVARFGSTARVAGELRVAHRGVAGWLRPAFVGCWLAGGTGLVAVGLSGLVAEVLGRVYGAAFVSGDAPGLTYTPDRCADYFEYFPHARDCADAAALHHWGEVVEGRVAVGVLGALALLVLWLVRRGTTLGTPAWTPPRGSVALPMTALFALAGVALSGLSLMQLAFRDTGGIGANLSAGLVSVAAAIVVVAWFLRIGRHRATG